MLQKGQPIAFHPCLNFRQELHTLWIKTLYIKPPQACERISFKSWCLPKILFEEEKATEKVLIDNIQLKRTLEVSFSVSHTYTR